MFTLNQIYQLDIFNASDVIVSPCLYWTIPGDDSMSAVAWQSATAAHTTRLRWEFQYTPTFICAAQSPQAGEVIASEIWVPVPFAFNNAVQLSFSKDGYSFGTPRPYGLPGTLHLMQDASVRADSASVGIAIDDDPALVAPSKPSTMLSIPAQLQLNLGFIAAAPGTILDMSQVKKPTPIKFPENVNAMYVTIRKDLALVITQHRSPSPRIVNTVDA